MFFLLRRSARNWKWGAWSGFFMYFLSFFLSVFSEHFHPGPARPRRVHLSHMECRYPSARRFQGIVILFYLEQCSSSDYMASYQNVDDFKCRARGRSTMFYCFFGTKFSFLSPVFPFQPVWYGRRVLLLQLWHHLHLPCQWKVHCWPEGCLWGGAEGIAGSDESSQAR